MNDQVRMPDFVVEVERKRVKNVNLRVYPRQGRVVISCPNRLPQKEVERFLYQKRTWITKKLNSQVPSPTPETDKLEDGTELFLWGDKRRLSVQKSKFRHSVASVSDTTIHILTKYPQSHVKLEQAVDDFYRSEIKKKLPEMIEIWESKMNVRVTEFGVKKMKTRWGTCNTRAKRIWLNLHLAKWPVECLEFIVVHEIVHLLERRHSARFYRLMDTYLSDWREREFTLKTYFNAGNC